MKKPLRYYLIVLIVIFLFTIFLKEPLLFVYTPSSNVRYGDTFYSYLIVWNPSLRVFEGHFSSTNTSAYLKSNDFDIFNELQFAGMALTDVKIPFLTPVIRLLSYEVLHESEKNISYISPPIGESTFYITWGGYESDEYIINVLP